MNTRTRKASASPMKEEDPKPGPKDLSHPECSRYHPKFDDSIDQGTDYLKKYIKIDPNNPTRFICVLCQDNLKKYHSGYCDNLKQHLVTDQHIKCHGNNEEEKKKLVESVNFLTEKLSSRTRGNETT